MAGRDTILDVDQHFSVIICIFKKENNLRIKVLEK